MTYFQKLQILAVFVMLGIGADDVFVFVDAFKQVRLGFPDVISCLDDHHMMFRCSIQPAILYPACNITLAYSVSAQKAS